MNAVRTQTNKKNHFRHKRRHIQDHIQDPSTIPGVTKQDSMALQDHYIILTPIEVRGN